jgi:branched-subunit amino acid ABC-type transport system permease component
LFREGGLVVFSAIDLTWVIRWLVIASSLSLYYIVFSLGIVLTFGMHKVVNFAHGAIYMVGAFTGFVIYNLTGSFIVALVGGFVGPFILGALLERVLISRLYGSDSTSTFLLTFALSFIMIGVVKFFAGAKFRALEVAGVLSGRLDFAGTSVPTYRLFFIGFTVLVIIAVYLFLTKTKVGSIVRAGTSDSTAVEVLGINVKNYFTLMFGVGSGLAGLTGVLFAPLFNLYPGMGDEVLLWGFIVVIIGGLGSFAGCIVGGIIIGLLHSFGTLVFGEYVMFVTYALLIIVLSVRPRGIFVGREV